MKNQKAVLINCSHRPKGNTYKSLNIVKNEFTDNNIMVRYIELCKLNIKYCTGCNTCGNSNCKLNDDFDSILKEVKDADILILGSPVYVGSIASLGMTFIQRLTSFSKNNGGILEGKIGSPIIVAGEAGHLTAYNQFTNFYTVNGMIVIGSDYWPVHTSSYKNSDRDNSSDNNMRKLSKNIIDLIRRN